LFRSFCCETAGGGKSGLHRAECQVMPGRREPTESTMRKVILSLLLLVALFAAAASARSATASCAAKCLTTTTTGAAATKPSQQEVVECIKSCIPEKKKLDWQKKLSKLTHKLDKISQQLLNKDVQKQEAVLSDMIEEDESSVLSDNSEILSDSSISNGATLRATTGLNVRSGPCTTYKIVAGLGSGQTTKYTGKSQSGCGYTWYSVTNGWVASNFVTVVGGGGGGGGGGAGSCKTRNYPLFKQCDGRWGGNALGSSSVCRIGCLMSSVSMALNGLGKSVNGQSPNPGTLNSFLRSNGGYQGSLFIWGSVSRFGLRYIGQPSSKAEIAKHICANNVVILNVNRGGHWVLATGVSADRSTFYVNDPGYNRSSYSAGEVGVAGIFTL